ncbi:SUMF1/EgtB/PvdO family nonheme iron enzyme [Actinomadura madurae]|uniref:SUMF1/EgtB/PvdO family nonheme iron enzyme n=1 Tax=Actinomadura madurae TaxID=1993 RepID=UPI000943E284|nr:SUMF1/EgtB/PvdO family nonheme iron enzyme [Actinomadura madurae]
MKPIPGGTYRMGSDQFYPEERPSHRVRVDGFLIDAHPVTVGEFRRFVEATGYVTTAERTPDRRDYPDADPSLLVPGSLVFTPPSGPVPLDDIRQWWTYLPGADWRAPFGHGSAGSPDRHPVTQVSWIDARAYASWAGKDLPTEAEWEWAARGGLDQAAYAWGDELNPNGRVMANTWQGDFPDLRGLRRGTRRRSRSPGGRFDETAPHRGIRPSRGRGARHGELRPPCVPGRGVEARLRPGGQRRDRRVRPLRPRH